MKFSYRARRDARTESSGVLEAPDFSEAVGRLRGMGLYPVEVFPIETERAKEKKEAMPVPLSRMDLALWARSIGDGLAAGMSLTQALHLVAEQEKGRPAGAASAVLENRITSGESLAGAMQQMGPVFSPMAAQLVRAGEESGSLEQVLHALAVESEAEAELIEKIRGALVYPTFVMAVGAATAAAVVWIVFPKLEILFIQTGQPLPWTIRFLSGALRLAGWGLLAAGVAAAACAWNLRKKKVRLLAESITRAGRMVRSLPWLGAFLRKVEIVRFTTTAALLLEQGLPLPEAIRLCAGTVQDEGLRAALGRAFADVMEGLPLSQSLRRSGLQELFLLSVIGVGEAQGDLAHSFRRAAARYGREVDHQVKRFGVLIEPVLILGVGLFVAGIVFSVMLPVFDLNFAIK